MSSRFLLVSYNNVAFTIAIYNSRKDAIDDVIDLLIKQENVVSLAKTFEDVFGKPFNRSHDFITNLFSDDEYGVWLWNAIQCTLVEVKDGKAFNQYNWSNWDRENLNRTLVALKTGNFGRLWWPYAEGFVLLHNY